MRRISIILSLLAILMTASLILTSACTQGTKGTGEQILRVNLAGEPAQIDPNRASWAAEKSVIAQVFVGLLGFNQDLSLRADVATVIPTVARARIHPANRQFGMIFRKSAAGSKTSAKNPKTISLPDGTRTGSRAGRRFHRSQNRPRQRSGTNQPKL